MYRKLMTQQLTVAPVLNRKNALPIAVGQRLSLLTFTAKQDEVVTNTRWEVDKL
jgi:hypothetical protein